MTVTSREFTDPEKRAIDIILGIVHRLKNEGLYDSGELRAVFHSSEAFASLNHLRIPLARGEVIVEVTDHAPKGEICVYAPYKHWGIE